METQTNVIPGAAATFEEPTLFVSKLAGCRAADDNEAWNRSARQFFNSTKLDRYTPTATNGPLACGGAPGPARSVAAPSGASLATELKYATFEKEALAPLPTAGYATLFSPTPYA